MQAAEKRKQEQEKLKAARIEHIIECTFDLFSEDGIESITMNDIAEQAEIGVATLYRYFSTKEDLAIDVAVYAWRMEEETFRKVFSSEAYDSLNGFEQLKVLLGIFPTALTSQSKFFRFIYYFDSFVKRESVSVERLNNYEQAISSLKDIVMKAIEKGENDGSINTKKSSNPLIAGASAETLYFAIMHALFSIAQKLSLSGEMLYMDRAVKPRAQMELLVNMLLESIKN